MNAQRTAFGLVASLMALGGCAEPLDTTQAFRPSRTLGQEVYLEACNRVAHQDFPHDVSGSLTRDTCFDGAQPPNGSSQRLIALHQERRRFIGALDAAVSPELATDMGDLLVSMLPLYDDGKIQAQTRALADVLQSVAQSPESLAALERIGSRQGYKPIHVALGLVKPVFTYPKLQALNNKLLRALAPGGSSATAFRKVLTASHLELRGLSSQWNGEPALLRDLLLREHPDITDGKKRYLAKRDARGVVEPALNGNGFIAPFVDQNNDGLADVNSAGRLVDVQGRAVTLATPFALPHEGSSESRDNYSRLIKNDALVYQYLDASDTFVAGALFETRDLLTQQSDVILDLVPPLSLVLGPRTTRHHLFDDGTQLSFDGFRLEESPLLDLVHAGASLVDKPVTYWTLRLAELMLDQHEPELATLLQTLKDIKDLASDLYPEAKLAPNNALLDDFMRIGVEVAREPGLLEDLLDAMTDPRTRALGGLYAKYMRNKDRINYNPANINGNAIGSLVTPVNRNAADTYDNRSVMQRFLHLIHDCNGAQMCNRPGAVLDLGVVTYPFIGSYSKCELFQIDNLATFYIEAVLGRAKITFKDSVVNVLSGLDFMLEDLSDIDGFTKSPTPRAINRFVFAPRNNFLSQLVDAPKSADGASIEARHPGTIFAWEQQDFFSYMQPLFKVFSDHGRLDLLVDIMSTMHLHWSSELTDTTQSYDSGETAFAKQSGIARFEELIATALVDHDLINKIADVVDVARDLDVDGVSGADILYDLPRQLLLPEWNLDLAGRDGTTVVETNDGTVVMDIAPAHLLVRSLRDVDSALDRDPTTRTSLEDAIQRISEQFLQTHPNGSGRRFSDRRGLAMLKMSTTFAREQLLDHWLTDDITQWKDSLVDDAENALDHPLTASGLALVDSIVSNASLRREIEELLVYLVDAPPSVDAFTSTLTSTADMVQLLDDVQNLRPILKRLAPLFDPQDGVLSSGVQLLKDTQELDQQMVVPRLLEALVTPNGGVQSETPLEALVDIVLQLNRTQPQNTSTLSRYDYEQVLNTTQTFLLDDENGLERLIKLIENR